MPSPKPSPSVSVPSSTSVGEDRRGPLRVYFFCTPAEFLQYQPGQTEDNPSDELVAFARQRPEICQLIESNPENTGQGA